MSTIQYLPKNNSPELSCMLNTIVKRILLLLIASTLLSQAHSQTDKRLILADQYFAEGEYFTAAGLYEQFLNPAVKEKPKSDFPLNSKKNAQGRIGTYVNRTDIQYKQAESYRLANYWMKASGLYKECFEKDAAKYSAALYWYAVCQRSTGNYAASEESINRFLNENGASNPYRQEAEREKKILQFIQSQLTRPDSILYHVKKIETSFGNEKGVFAPAAGLGNQFMITSTQTDSVVAPGINPNHNRLFYSALTNGTLQNIQPVIIEGADPLLNQGAASISANGNYLYFTQWTKENGQVLSSIYYAIKNENGWGKPIFLNSVNQKGYSSKQPFCSGDGKYLFFASDRTGGKGNFDIWYAPLQADGTTGAPVNAGVVLNTAENELAPFYHSSSNTLIFSSDRMPGMGGYDLFMSNGTETIWKTPENMGYPVNSSRDDVYFFAAEKGTVFNNAFFSSDRGSECCLATYTVSKSPKKRMIAGVIRDCRDNEPVADAEVIMKDALGKTVRTTTGIDGKYTFELAGNNQQHQFFVSKEKYSEKTADMIVEGKNETHWLTDTLYNGTLCIDKKLVIKVENVVTVYFDFDKSQLKERGVAQLDSIYNVLAENVTATIQISGYTDGLGTAEYNKVLSDKRAKTCADYLIGKGIDTNRISFESFGACCPIEMELINGRDNPDGRSMNRRALINIDKD